MKGQYSVDFLDAPSSLRENNQKIEKIRSKAVVDFEYRIRSDRGLYTTFEPVEDDVYFDEFGKEVPTKKPRLCLIRVVTDSTFYESSFFNSKAHVDPEVWRPDRLIRIKAQDPRDVNSRIGLDVVDPRSFFMSKDYMCDWMRRLATCPEEERKTFKLEQDGRYWVLSFEANNFEGLVLSFTFDSEIGFNQVESRETYLGKPRYLRTVKWNKVDDVYLPSDVYEEIHDFEHRFCDSIDYKLVSMELNPKFSMDHFGLERFDLRNGDTVDNSIAGTRLRYWDGELVSEEEF